TQPAPAPRRWARGRPFPLGRPRSTMPVVGEKQTIVNIIGATVGSVSVGDGSSSSGSVTQSPANPSQSGGGAQPGVPQGPGSTRLDVDAPIDFAILTAIEVERRAVCAAFGLGDDHRVKKGSRVYWRGRLLLTNGEAYELVVAQSPDMAN